MGSKSSIREHSGWAIWITGLPGCGKSTMARLIRDSLHSLGFAVRILEMDARRKVYIPDPAYTPQERELAYAHFVEEAAFLAKSGKGIIMDATAHRLSMRNMARRIIPKFAEVHLQCRLETAMVREAGRPEGKVMAQLYAKAKERKESGRTFEGLGDVVGVDVPYEENPLAECIVNMDSLDRIAAHDKILAFLLGWL